MKIGAIIAVLSRLLDFILRALERRHEADIENEVRDDVAKDATIADLRRADQIKDRVSDVRRDDRLRRADSGGAPAQDGYRD